MRKRNCDPHVEHETAAKHVLRYLSATKNLKLHFRKTGKQAEGFVDADWGSSVDDRRSYTGYAFTLAGCVFSWESKKQVTVALSSTEAEYMALSAAAKEAVYLKNLLREIDCYNSKRALTMYGDNLSSQHLAQNPVYHNRSKHIDIRFHYIREVVKNNVIDLRYLSTDNMPADLLTKNLCKSKHVKLIELLGMKQ
uniref:Retrovirus-related Pol polyprotein from transposon TNT 1-94 n=1 Tax=Bactrocera dorsalis TaxID=27457 RepID=A0A034WRD0_BACDO